MLYIAGVKELSSLKDKRSLKWSYLGSFAGLNKVQAVFDPAQRIYVGKSINELAEQHRNNFVDYIGRISQFQRDPVLWYSSRIASKSVSQTSMFQSYVYVKAAEVLAALPGDSVLIIEDRGLLKTFGKLRLNAFSVRGGDGLIVHFRNLLKKLKHTLGFARYTVFWFILKFYYNKPDPGDYRALIYSWIEDEVFKDAGVYKDRFFADLEQRCSGQGLKIGRFTVPITSFRHLRGIKERFPDVMISLAYLGFRDLCRVWSASFRVNIPGEEFPDIHDKPFLDLLLKTEEALENRTYIFRYYLLCYYSFQGMNRYLKNPVPVIYMFENQPFEKMLNLAFTNSFRIGYQHTIIPQNWLDYYLSPHEKNVPLPSLIITSGKRWTSFIKEHFSAKTAVSEGGALRFRHLLSKQRNTELGGKIVIALPAYAEIALALQNQLALALKLEPALSSYKILIKPHPYLPDFAVLKGLFSGFPNCGFSTEPVSGLLADCRLLVTSGTTVAYESVLTGIPTVYLVPESFSDGTEYYLKEHLYVCYENTFLQTFQGALKDKMKPLAEISDYFSEPDYGIFCRELSREKH